MKDIANPLRKEVASKWSMLYQYLDKKKTKLQDKQKKQTSLNHQQTFVNTNLINYATVL